MAIRVRGEGKIRCRIINNDWQESAEALSLNLFYSTTSANGAYVLDTDKSLAITLAPQGVVD